MPTEVPPPVAEDWKAWLELSLLVAVTLLAVGRWIFRAEHADVDQGRELIRMRDRVHSLASDLSKIVVQVSVLEDRVAAQRERIQTLEEWRNERGGNPRRQS